MTLVLTVNGSESIWLLADRRLSAKGRPFRDDACKIMFLETTDGQAILGYAGLGATASGTEPSDWMAAVLRGRNLPLEQSLGVLADALKSQFPRHMQRIIGSGLLTHTVVVTAFVSGELRHYTIDLVFAPDRTSYKFRYTRHVFKTPTLAAPGTPRIDLAGSGGVYLWKQKRGFIRNLLRLVNANDREKVSSRAVADHLANLNHDVSLHDESVGPRCIVAWRYRKGGRLAPVRNGGQRYYTGSQQDPNSPALPTIARGMALKGFFSALMQRMLAGEPAPEWNGNEISEQLAHLPGKPDETLR